jgi:hypothetical protein
MPWNLAFKSGNGKLYSILVLSAKSEDSTKAFAVGYGLGREFKLSRHFTLNPELTSQVIFLGDEFVNNNLTRLNLQFNILITKYLSFFVGPSFNVYFNDPASRFGLKFKYPSSHFPQFDLWGDNTKGWIGLNAGISIF